MSIADALKHAADKPAGKRPYFMTPEVERVLAITMALAQELAVSHQRNDTVERLLEAKGLITRAEIEGFVPSEEQFAERSLWSQEFINRILRIVQQEAQAAAGNKVEAVDDVAKEIARP